MALVLVAAMVSTIRAKDEKLKAEQVIAKHLESIGSPEKLKQIKTRATAGVSHVEFKVGGTANMTGEGNILSDGNSLRTSFKFPSAQYPGEQFAFNGTDTFVAQVTPGTRSTIGTFIYENNELMRQGLLFGELSTSWIFLDSSRQLKMDLSGPKKIDGKSVYELKYIPKRGGIITAYFYFDSESFRHIRSQFKAEVAPTNLGQKITDSAETTRYTITEEFGDFKQVDDLTLPHSYRLDYSIDSARGGFVGSWQYVVNQVVHNQPIPKQVFSGN
jgi:hypothetical protein